MPIDRGTSDKARSRNIAQFTRDAKAGTSKHIKSQAQAVAAAYSEQRAAKKRAKRKKGKGK